jgi:Protein of unknown function (DUF3040)
MALSMDEQRILEEIERCLADEDPRLAARLTSFGHPGVRVTLRSRRGRMVASLIALVALAVIAVAAYAVIPLGLRHPARPQPSPSSSRQPVVTLRQGTSSHTPAGSLPAHAAQRPSASPSVSRSAS